MRFRHTHIWLLAFVGVLCASTALAERGMDMPFTYQGQLMEDGQPVTDQVNFTFSLWDAATGGTQIGTGYTPPDPVDVVDGLFTVAVETMVFGPDAFYGEPRWLEIAVYETGVGWVTLSPRQPITPAPYALYAFNSSGGGGDCLWSENGSDIYFNTGEVGVGTSTPSYPLHAISTGGNTAVAGENPGESTSGYLGHEYGGVYGEGSYAGYFVGRGYFSGNVGVGLTNPSEKLDINGTAKMTGFQLSTSPVAGHVLTANSQGVGTWQPGGGGSLWQENGTKIYYNTDNVGIGTADPNAPLHVTTSGDPVAVLARNTATTGSGNGVWGETGSSTGMGVFGQNTNGGTGNHAGVKGVAWGSFAQGVMGYNGSTSSTAIGVLGRTSSGAGVKGEATSTTSSNAIGVHGQTSSTNGYGVYGYAPGNGKGVAGYSDEGYGYLGWNGGGVYGYSADGYGVRGYSANDWGVFGSVPNGSTQAGVVGAITLDNGGTLWKSNSGVSGGCQSGQGVAGRTISGIGVFGEQTNSGNIGHVGASTSGVFGDTDNASNYGVWGRTTGNYSTTNGVYGQATGATWGIGVRGSVSNTNGVGVYGYNGGTGYAGEFYSDSGSAARFLGHDDDCVIIDHDAGITNTTGLVIDTAGSYGEQVGMAVTVDAEFGKLATFDLNGAAGYLSSAFLVTADNSGNVVEIIGEYTSSNEDTLRVQSDGYGSAIYGYNSRNQHDAPGVHGYHISSTSYYGIGVKGEGGYKGVEGRATGGDGTGYKYGVYGYAANGATNYAGYFSGNLRCTGTLQKGSGTFMIDHPLDPENKYLYHSFVESPDMMNIYNGNVVLDDSGQAVVAMPEWFEALNMEFRYQLTCIGGFAQVYIAEEIADNQFKIAGGKAGLKVSWQVTGIRQDPFANANRVQVEVDKPEDEVGTYIHPEAWGVSPDLQTDRVREARRQTELEETQID